MYAVRRWAVRQARLHEILYNLFEPSLVRLHGLWRRIGYDRLEKPVAEIIQTSGVLEGRIPRYPNRDKDLAEKKRTVL